MPYLNCYVAAVANDKRDAFIEHARQVADVFIEHGASQVMENWGDEVPDGKLTSLPMAVKCDADETVIVGWVIWPTKEAHDAGWPKVMQDPRMSPEHNEMPFDGKRMIFGAFENVVAVNA